MPDTPDTLIAHAAAHYRSGDYDRAALCAQEIVAQAPEHFDALHLLGVLCLKWERWADAACYLARAARQRPNDARLNINRGNAFLALKLFASAADAFGQVLAADPHNIDALNSLGVVRLGQQQTGQAIKALQAVLAREPGHAPARFNLGNALAASGRLEDAAAAYRTALARAASDTPADRIADVASALGKVLADLDRPDDALAVCRDYLRRYPDHPVLTWNLSLLLLRLGDYAAGWRAYESRWLVKDHARRRDDATVPNIASIGGKRILLISEQGRGDTIQFVRYAPALTALGATVYLQVYDDLKPLMAGMPGVARVIGEGEHEPPFDIVTPLLTMPLAFATELGTIPATVPYLHADADRVTAWRSRLGPATKPRVGLTWHSMNPMLQRSLSLEVLTPLLDMRDISFHALQKEFPEPDRDFLVGHGGIADHRSELRDFAETAALIETMDLVITIDTAVAHLAGAMGKPVWIMLPFVAEWRWLRYRDDSPWYPTARLFRQTAAGDWVDLMSRVAAALADRFTPDAPARSWPHPDAPGARKRLPR